MRRRAALARLAARAAGSARRRASAAWSAPGWPRSEGVLERWAPPGGWLMAALVLVTLSASRAWRLPASPAGMALQTLVGRSARRWCRPGCGWIAWRLCGGGEPPTCASRRCWCCRRRGCSRSRCASRRAAAWWARRCSTCSKRASGARAGLALASIAAAAALVNAVGLERIRWLTVLGTLEVPPALAGVSRLAMREVERQALRVRAPRPRRSSVPAARSVDDGEPAGRSSWAASRSPRDATPGAGQPSAGPHWPTSATERARARPATRRRPTDRLAAARHRACSGARPTARRSRPPS